MDTCLYFFGYSPDVLKKKKKVLDIFNTDKKCFMIRIRFIEINESPSLVKIVKIMITITVTFFVTTNLQQNGYLSSFSMQRRSRTGF